MLVMAMPRVAMQAQRVREETLIYRGEQYKRAVQLYFRKYKKYPAKLDDLEESDGVRFLRRRYKDPLTGEDEWRLIHMGSDGRFKDSLLFDQEKDEDVKKNPYARTVGRGPRPPPVAGLPLPPGTRSVVRIWRAPSGSRRPRTILGRRRPRPTIWPPVSPARLPPTGQPVRIRPKGSKPRTAASRIPTTPRPCRARFRRPPGLGPP